MFKFYVSNQWKNIVYIACIYYYTKIETFIKQHQIEETDHTKIWGFIAEKESSFSCTFIQGFLVVCKL